MCPINNSCDLLMKALFKYDLILLFKRFLWSYWFSSSTIIIIVFVGKINMPRWELLFLTTEVCCFFAMTIFWIMIRIILWYWMMAYNVDCVFVAILVLFLSIITQSILPWKLSSLQLKSWSYTFLRKYTIKVNTNIKYMQIVSGGVNKHWNLSFTG